MKFRLTVRGSRFRLLSNLADRDEVFGVPVFRPTFHKRGWSNAAGLEVGLGRFSKESSSRVFWYPPPVSRIRARVSFADTV